VLDASRSVTVVGSLLNKDLREGFLKNTEKDYTELKTGFENKKPVKEYLSYAEALKNKCKINWATYQPTRPAFTGIRAFDEYDLNALRSFIDWKPFFIAWEMHGSFPEILSDKIVGKEATRLYADANALLDQLIAEKWLTAKGVIGFWEANSKEDSVEINSAGAPVSLHFLRQQIRKAAGQPNLSLADFIAPTTAGYKDYIGAFAVTIDGIEPHIQRMEAAHDDYNKIMLQALADRFAEAFAEALHLQTRTTWWGYDPSEHLSNDELIKEKYTGIRPAPGYPACPDHTEKYPLFNLLQVTQYTGIQLTENLAMYPASSVCGWYMAHPDARYFGVGRIEKDQFEDYTLRKGTDRDEMEKWLRPVLE
jgi:5-methyltetrahydrofolate--homocysteine methyltransferase